MNDHLFQERLAFFKLLCFIASSQKTDYRKMHIPPTLQEEWEIERFVRRCGRAIDAVADRMLRKGA